MEKKSIYTKVTHAANTGTKVFVDLESRSLKLGKKFLVKDGKNLTDLPYLGDIDYDVMEALEEYYVQYKYSKPTERSDAKRKNPFVALSAEDLDDDDYLFGVGRDIAKARLETFFLCAVLSGNLKWDESWGNVFWQSSNEPSFIIFRKWVA